MDFTKSKLYGVCTKRQLYSLLKIKNPSLLRQSNIITHIHPRIDTTGKPRLIEAPDQILQPVQRRLLKLLQAIELPPYIFSGVRGKSYVDNAKYHADSSIELYKVDISKFFPAIRREKVYSFFKKDLNCSPDVAGILSDLTTVNLDYINPEDSLEVHSFVTDNKCICRNHLITGAPTCQLLAYLVNYQMFDELYGLSNNNKIKMSVYVDDITFSSPHKIRGQFRDTIIKIIKKYGYHVSIHKTRIYKANKPKIVTGVVITKTGGLAIKNSLQYKIAKTHNLLRLHPDNTLYRQKLRGLLSAAKCIDANAFPTIHQYSEKNDFKIN